MVDGTAKKTVLRNLGKDVSPVKSLLLSTGVMLVIYGVAIAVLIGLFGLGSDREEEATVTAAPAPTAPVTSTTTSDQDAVLLQKPQTNVVEGVTPVDASRADAVLTGNRTVVQAMDSVARVTNAGVKNVDLKNVGTGKESADPPSVGLETIAAVVDTTSDRTSRLAENAPALVDSDVRPSSKAEDQTESQVLISSFDRNTGLSLSGRVVDTQQAPLEGLQVYVRKIDDLENHVAMTKTNRGGDFQLPRLEKSDYIVTTAFGDTISVYEFATSGSVDLHIVSGQAARSSATSQTQAIQSKRQQTADGVVTNPPAGQQYQVVGIVQSSAGQPLSDVEIRFGAASPVLTGLDGTYKLSLGADVLQATVSLQFSRDGFSEEMRSIPASFWEKSHWFRQDVVLRER